MYSLAVLAVVTLVVNADPGASRIPCASELSGDYSQAVVTAPVPSPVASIEPVGAGNEPSGPPRAPRGAWWYGARVPVPYQQDVYYPTWDTPVWLLTHHPPLGTPAVEVPQREATPAFWKPLDR